MAFRTAYIIQFTDQEQAQWNIQLQLDGYSGNPAALVGAASPLNIRYEGGEDDIFEPIRKSKATIRIYMRATDQSIFDTLKYLTDTTMYVVITSSLGYKWLGWMTPDQVERKFALDGYELQMTAVDPFSYALDSVMQMANGQVIEGKHRLIDFLHYCIQNAIIDDIDFRYRITHILNYAGASNTGPYDDTLTSVSVYANNFLDSDGRPQKGDDIISGILQSLGMYTFMSNGEYYFRCPLALFASQIRTNYVHDGSAEVITNDNLIVNIGFKENGQPFLVANDEILSNDRPLKSVSASFPYNNTVSILPNSQFYGYDANTKVFTGWNKNLGQYLTDVYRVGSGTTDKPYAARLVGKAPPGLDNQGTVNANRFWTTSMRSVNEGVKLSLNLRYRYYDYRKAIPAWDPAEGADLNFPYQIRLRSGSTTYYVRNNNGEITWTTDYLNGWQLQRIYSTDAVQSASLETAELPAAGDIEILFLPITLSSSIPYEQSALAQWDLISAILSIQATTDATGNSISGQKHYLTQQQKYSLSGDTVDMVIADAPNDTIGGALFKGLTNDLTTNWINSIIGSNYNLAHSLLAIRLFFSRYPKQKFDGTIYSNTLTFDKVLRFRNGNADIMEGLFMQLNDDYEVKSCIHKIIAMSLTGAARETGSAADVYEYINTYN